MGRLNQISRANSLESTKISLCMVATGQEIVREKKFFKVREKSGNFTLSQEKFTSLKKVREK